MGTSGWCGVNTGTLRPLLRAELGAERHPSFPTCLSFGQHRTWGLELVAGGR